MAMIDEYKDALTRIKNNNPIRVQKGSRINNDTVALEAGRARGSIKKSRKIFSALIDEIEKAAKSQTQMDSNPIQNRLEKWKKEKEHYRLLYHKALNRELMLLEQIADLEKRQNA